MPDSADAWRIVNFVIAKRDDAAAIRAALKTESAGACALAYMRLSRQSPRGKGRTGCINGMINFVLPPVGAELLPHAFRWTPPKQGELLAVCGLRVPTGKTSKLRA